MEESIVTNPVRVLRMLALSVDERLSSDSAPPVDAWVSVISGARKEKGWKSKYRAILFVEELCATIDKTAAARQMIGINLLHAWTNDTSNSGSARSVLSDELAPDLVTNFAIQLDDQYPVIEVSTAVEFATQLSQTVDELRSQPAPSGAALALEVADYLEGSLLPAIEESIALKVWLVGETFVGEISSQLISQGLAMQIAGSGGHARLVVGIAATLAGLVPPLAVPMALLSIAHSLADDRGLYDAVLQHHESRRTDRTRGLGSLGDGIE